MPDERLVKQLAGIIHHHAGGCGCGDPDFGDERAADDILVLLAGQGRLVPDGATVKRDRRLVRDGFITFPSMPEYEARNYGGRVEEQVVIHGPWVTVPAEEDPDVHL